MAGVAEPRLYGCLVRLGAVGHHDLHAAAPSMPLGSQKAAQSLGVAVGHHGEHLAGVAVDEHRHIPVPLADRGLVHQQHPTPLPPTMVGDQTRPGHHQSVDQLPAHLVTLRRRVDRHLTRVGHQPTGQTRRDTALERRMVLHEPPAAADAADHAPLLEHQRHRPARHLQVADLPVPAIMSLPARGPAIRTTRAAHRRAHPHHQPLRRVDHHPQHFDTRQPQPHRHNITLHRGPPGFGISQHRSPHGLDPYKRTLNPPSSQQKAKGHLNWCRSIVGYPAQGPTPPATAQHEDR